MLMIKKRFFLAAIAGVASVVFAGAAQADINAGLVASYPLDGDATDASVNSNDLTNQGAGAASIDYQAGKVGQAVNLDRTEGNQFLRVDNTDIFGNTGLTQQDTSTLTYTWQAWINPDFASIINTSGDGYFIVTPNSTIGGGHGFAIAGRIDGGESPAGSGRGKLDTFVEKGYDILGGFLFASNHNHDVPASVDGWYHVLATFDGSVEQHKLYLNGALIGTVGTVIGSGSNDSSSAISTNGLILGADQNVAPGDDLPGRFFDGLIDEVAIWDRVLLGGEINELYNNGAGQAIADIPEPGTLVLLSFGLALLVHPRTKRG